MDRQSWLLLGEIWLADTVLRSQLVQAFCLIRRFDNVSHTFKRRPQQARLVKKPTSHARWRLSFPPSHSTGAGRVVLGCMEPSAPSKKLLMICFFKCHGCSRVTGGTITFSTSATSSIAAYTPCGRSYSSWCFRVSAPLAADHITVYPEDSTHTLETRKRSANPITCNPPRDFPLHCDKRARTR